MIKESNVDEIFFRGAVISIMRYFSKNLKITQTIDNVKKEYDIPVFYQKVQDSQFMRDYFTNYSTDCLPIQYVDGDFDMEPFVIINTTDITIKMSDMTNKFVRGNYVVQEKDENGYPVNKSYSALLYSIPIEIKYSVEIRTDDASQSFKIIQSILDGVFKNAITHFTFRNMRIRCNITLDNTYTPDKKLEFVYTDEQKEKIKFNIVLECYYPIFDKSTTLFKGDVIRNFRNYIDSSMKSSSNTSESSSIIINNLTEHPYGTDIKEIIE